MWKPDAVVPEHKGRARLIWAGLILAMGLYTLWQIVVIAIERANPSTSLTITDEPYDFPFVMVCMWEDIGCGYSDPSICAQFAVDNDATVQYGDNIIYGTVSEQFSNCVAFDLTSIDVKNGGDDQTRIEAVLSMWWTSADDATAETSYSESVGLYLGEEGAEQESYEIVHVPYNRNEFAAAEKDVGSTTVTIGKTVRKFISGGPVTTFPALTISTTGYKTTEIVTDLTSDAAFGWLQLQITQGSYSFTNIKDIDPLELGTFLGNLGGFWEILVLVWGVCFIATTRETSPTLKGRNFTKSVQRGAEMATKRRSLSQPSSAATQIEERPGWESTYGSSTSPNGTSRIRSNFHSSGGSARVSDVDASNSTSRRPVAYVLPRRTSDTSGKSSNCSAPAYGNGGASTHESSDEPPPSYRDHVRT